MIHEFTYPVNLAGDKGEPYTVTFPDFPEALTDGDTIDEALAEAVDCLEEAVAARIDDGEEIPAPSKIGEASFPVSLPAQMALKAAIYSAMADSGMTKVALAGLVHLNEKEARRIVDPHHGTKLPTLEQALKALGKSIQLRIV